MVDAAPARESKPVKRLHGSNGPDAGALILAIVGAVMLPMGFAMDSYGLMAFGAALALLGAWLLVKGE